MLLHHDELGLVAPLAANNHSRLFNTATAARLVE